MPLCVVLVGSMYVMLFLALAIPASQAFHQFEIPPADLTVAAVAIGAVACAMLEAIHQFHRSWIRKSEAHRATAGHGGASG